MWNVDSSGNWSVSGNWSGGVPHAAGDTATFGTVITAQRTVTLDANEAVGSLTMSSPFSYVIAAAGNTLTLDNKGAGATVTVTAGTANAIQTLVSLNDNATVSVSGGASPRYHGQHQQHRNHADTDRKRGRHADALRRQYVWPGLLRHGRNDPQRWRNPPIGKRRLRWGPAT